MAKRKLNTQPLWRFLFLVYCAIMVWLLYGRGRGVNPNIPYWDQVQKNLVLTPFYTVRTFLDVVLHSPGHPEYWLCLTNLLGNVFLFIPAGYLLPRIFKKFRPFWRFFLNGLLLLIAVELTQLFTLLGVFDVDDLILNMAGFCIGYLAYFLFRKR